MSEISTIKGMSVNAIQNAQLLRRYEKHISKIIEINHKKSNIKNIFEQQKKISEILKKSKQASKSFKEKQMVSKCQAQNKRLLKSLSTINTRQRVKTQKDYEQPRKRMKKNCKEGILREFQIERQNRMLAHNIVENVCDVQRYRKKIGKQISQYERLKNQLQRLKPLHLDKNMHAHQTNSRLAKIKNHQASQEQKESKGHTLRTNQEKPNDK